MPRRSALTIQTCAVAKLATDAGRKPVLLGAGSGAQFGLCRWDQQQCEMGRTEEGAVSTWRLYLHHPLSLEFLGKNSSQLWTCLLPYQHLKVAH